MKVCFHVLFIICLSLFHKILFFFQVSLEKKLAYVKYDPDLTTSAKICSSIDDMGFDATLQSPNPTVIQCPDHQVTRIHVEGMTCQSCVKNIERTIGSRSDVFSVSVSLEDKRAVIEYNAQSATEEVLREAIEDMGFDASLIPIDIVQCEVGQDPTCIIEVIGMTCQSCVKNIESSIKPKKGILDIKVSLEKKEAIVKYNPEQLSAADIADLIDDVGFEAKVKPITSNNITSSHPTDGCGSPKTQITIGVQGMVCSSCVQSIESQIKNTSGVYSVNVSLEREEAVVVYDPATITAETIRLAIEDMGFDATLAGM